ncbi:MAG: heavy metal translocating P-type ATPase, partial [Planctomycetes bacterium]|nr:heavy metal translocating P-type ATPase [Planctomycetota bacterium]
ADRIARVFVPAVLAIAAATGAVWWLAAGDGAAAAIAAASVLAVACPCALGLAIPTAIAVAGGRAAGAGILLRDGAVLESAARIDAVVLDKTGTLTAGRPALDAVDCASGWQRAEVLRLAAAVARGSAHPLSRAVVAAAGEAPAASGFTHQPGAGSAAQVDGRTVLVGSATFLASHGVAPPDGLPALAAELSEALVAVDGQWCARLAFRDPLRPAAAAAVQHLRALGCQVILASGDRQPAVAAAAAAVGIGEFHHGCTSAAKLRVVEDLRARGRTVAMVGDGINDAEALAAADLGVALGTGTDVAAAAGSVLLPGDDLGGVPRLIVLSRRTRAAIHRNLALAAVYNLVAIPLAAGALAPALGWRPDPMWAAAAMAASSLAVVGSSLLLRWTRLTPRPGR